MEPNPYEAPRAKAAAPKQPLLLSILFGLIMLAWLAWKVWRLMHR
jgi:hypothetical protein